MNHDLIRRIELEFEIPCTLLYPEPKKVDRLKQGAPEILRAWEERNKSVTPPVEEVKSSFD